MIKRYIKIYIIGLDSSAGRAPEVVGSNPALVNFSLFNPKAFKVSLVVYYLIFIIWFEGEQSILAP